MLNYCNSDSATPRPNIPATRLPQVMACPASPMEVRRGGYTGGSRSPMAREGTAAHQRIIEQLRQWCATGQRSRQLAPEEEGAVKATQDFIRQLSAMNQNPRIFIENAVQYSPLTNTPGRIDVLILADCGIYIIDYKTGQKRVWPETPTMMAYAAGVLNNFCVCPDTPVNLWIYQTTKKAEFVQSKGLTAEKIRHWEQTEMNPAIRSACQPFPEHRPGPNCRYCPARYTCTAFLPEGKPYWAMSNGELDQTRLSEETAQLRLKGCIAEMDKREQKANGTLQYEHYAPVQKTTHAKWKPDSEEFVREYCRKWLPESAISSLNSPPAIRKVLPPEAWRELENYISRDPGDWTTKYKG